MESSNEQILRKVTEYARGAHGDQKRKYTPDPYIVHPIRVMEICRTYTGDITILSAALLHDVLEDTPVTKNELADFLMSLMKTEDAQRTIRLVTELTDVYVKTAYPQWNRRKRKAKELERMAVTSAEAQTVKYADIIDNCSEIVGHDPDFARLFLHECRALLLRMKEGNGDLYARANELVEGQLQRLSAGG